MAQDNQSTASSATSPKKQMSHEELVRQVADKVWAIWREDLRREEERRGKRK